MKDSAKKRDRRVQYPLAMSLRYCEPNMRLAREVAKAHGVGLQSMIRICLKYADKAMALHLDPEDPR